MPSRSSFPRSIQPRQRECRRSRSSSSPKPRHFPAWRRLFLRAGRRALSRLASNPKGLALTEASPPGRYTFIQPGRALGFSFSPVFWFLATCEACCLPSPIGGRMGQARCSVHLSTLSSPWGINALPFPSPAVGVAYGFPTPGGGGRANSRRPIDRFCPTRGRGINTKP